MAEQVKRTPGPWKAEVMDCDAARIPNEDGNLFWEITPEEPRFDALYISTTGWMTEGNARLIAAAPELLEALKACHLQMLQSNNDSEYAQQANQLAVAAIAKAEGRS